MKIALVVPGGVDRSGTHRVIPALLWLIERLAREHAVTVFALNQTDSPEVYPLLGATIVCLGRAGSIRHAPAVVRQIVGAGPFDVVHGFWASPMGLIAALAARPMHVPSVVSLCGGELAAVPSIQYGALLHWRSRLYVSLALRLAMRITASSRFMIAQAKRHGFDAAEVPLGVPDEYFAPFPVPHDAPPQLLHVASINRVKDPPSLLRAMRRVADAIPNAHLDIVGEDTLRGEMQRLAHTLNLDEHVTFHGFKTADETRAFYQRAHVFLLPSLHDAAPVVVLEAAAHGVPSVGSNVGYVADWSPERAVAVAAGDDAALADATLRLIREPNLRRALGQSARQWARAHDANWTAATFANLYSQLRNT